MRIRLIIILLAGVVATLVASAGNDVISQLDMAIANRSHFVSIKQNRIDSLRRLALAESKDLSRLSLYNNLFHEYLTFNFDSAMTYVDRAARIADQIGDYDLKSQVEIHRALSLATSGHFSHAIAILDRIDSRRLSLGTREEYFAACEWTYGVWAEYSDKRTISPELTAKSLVYLDSLIDVTDSSVAEYDYRIAEKALRLHKYSEAEKNYLEVLGRVPVGSRLYAQAAYALALAYKGLNNKEKYKEWLTNAAISDQTVPLKENLALQQLALYLKTEDGDLARANSYLKLALEDAIYYNNRLRMLEIAEKIPEIANVYQETIERKNSRLSFYILIIGMLSLLLTVSLVYVYRQHKIASRSKDAFAELNEKLRIVNNSLSMTNKSREQYVSLFMDLCAAYIEKLNRFPMVLKLKVKQLGDISSVAERYVRPSEAETREMFFNFDTAFLRLYPDFINQFNSLLMEDRQIMPKKGELLNTDLRIYALVRMGISDSNKIAVLLFLSSQTIFNHRTQVRNRAKNRDTFEKSIMEICPVLPEETL
ncbi:MAG: hypothetical protein K2L91_03380 [Duncaniella sp.]|nr:hypothetical protein [Duncaniella sp.]MDE6465360.1 hypothetical protein [Duncaniella sp.]